MARLDLIRDALIEAPEEFGLRFVYPQPRIDAPPRPVLVTEVKTGYPDYTLTYSRHNLGGNEELVCSDVLWHQESNFVALATQRVEHNRIRVRGLVLPDYDEATGDFTTWSGGQGHWVAVMQAWLTTWELPSELKNLTEMVDMASPDFKDFLPNTRKYDRQGWVESGRLDPDKMLTRRTSKFLAQQRVAMQRLSEEIPAEEETELFPTTAELLPGESKTTVIPYGGPEADGKIISYPDQQSKLRPEGG